MHFPHSQHVRVRVANAQQDDIVAGEFGLHEALSDEKGQGKFPRFVH
jgi:hypothetical protein